MGASKKGRSRSGGVLAKGHTSWPDAAPRPTQKSAAPVTHSQTVGRRGPVLEQDGNLHEALQALVYEKVPERPVHVKGCGAFGTFETTRSMTEHTRLSFLQAPRTRVPVMVRFSLGVSAKGTPDTSRNIRGFATKLYADDGVYDLVCNHIPVLFVRDGIRFPEAIEALSPSPISGLPDPQRFWSFVARAPEATHFLVWLYSDVGTVKSFRHVCGHSVNAYVWRNARGERRYVKYRWVPVGGEQHIDREEAIRLAGVSPDVAGRDLFDAIAAKRKVEFDLFVQLMDPADEPGLPFDPLDDTKVWDEEAFPLVEVGRMTLDRNPDDYVEQIEKVAFSPTNLLDGVELSNDKVLQSRANVYADAQRHRLGADFRRLPVNRQSAWRPRDVVSSGEGSLVSGQLVRTDLAEADDFSQAGEHYRSLDAAAQAHLAENLAIDLALAAPEARRIVLGYLSRASEELGERVRRCDPRSGR
ncbi:MAG: catalase [Labilithrix sp.]|nr:catalase [Labilithrix sp.]